MKAVRSATTSVSCVTAVLSFSVTVNTWSVPQQPLFSSRIETVRLDVSVRQGGQALRGLSEADFEVLDNGVAQTVDNVVPTTETTRPAAGWPSGRSSRAENCAARAGAAAPANAAARATAKR